MSHHNGRGPKFDDNASRRFMDALSKGNSDVLDNMVTLGPRSENRRAVCSRIVAEYLRRGGELPLPYIWPSAANMYEPNFEFTNPELDGTFIPNQNRWQEFQKPTPILPSAGGYVCITALGY